MTRHWLRPRPLLVILMLVVAPGAALAHLLINWAPESLALNRMTRDLHQHAAALEAYVSALATLQQQTTQMRELADKQSNRIKQQWLGKRAQDDVSEQIADALEGDGVRVDRISFGSPALFAAAEEAGVLACEDVSVACSGSYEGLVLRLDAFEKLDLPCRLTHTAWSRDRGAIEVTLDLQVPFLPEGELDAALRVEAGINEDDDDEL